MSCRVDLLAHLAPGRGGGEVARKTANEQLKILLFFVLFHVSKI